MDYFKQCNEQIRKVALRFANRKAVPTWFHLSLDVEDTTTTFSLHNNTFRAVMYARWGFNSYGRNDVAPGELEFTAQKLLGKLFNMSYEEVLDVWMDTLEEVR